MVNFFLKKREQETFQLSDLSLQLNKFSITLKNHPIFFMDHFETSLSGWTLLHGLNGSGKSTFIRAMLGLFPTVHGTLRLLGQSPQKARSLVGYMSQKREENALFLPTLSHVEAAIPSSSGLFSFRKRKAEALSLLEECGAGHLANRPLKVLSGGERQKIALAQAIAGNPRLLILDEPFIALDFKTREEMVRLLRFLEQKRRIGIFITTHEDVSFLPSERRDLYLRNGSLSCA
ncbi:ATP-binding cassette domain-containing protein [Acetobacteraceae bacterium]|nr:ATP-binding cassette domain-containing protein [Acetobacteraceae bacterium]